MANDYKTIVSEIDKHLSLSGMHYYSNFYIGITHDVEQRLFHEHNVSRENAWWIYRTAINDQTAKQVEKHYLDLGMRGGPGGGEGDSRIVYCYVVSPTTVE